MSGTAIGAGFLAVLISYSGLLLIYLQAAEAREVSHAVLTSWVFAICMGAGVSCISLSLCLRAPTAMAWSIPGTVLLISIGQQMSEEEVVGAYLLVASALIPFGLSGLFERLIRAACDYRHRGRVAAVRCNRRGGPERTEAEFAKLQAPLSWEMRPALIHTCLRRPNPAAWCLTIGINSVRALMSRSRTRFRRQQPWPGTAQRRGPVPCGAGRDGSEATRAGYRRSLCREHA